MVFREKHFETTKYLRRKDDIYTDFRSYGGEYDTSAYHQFYPRLLRLEEKYPNFANIEAGSGHYILYNSNGTVDNSDFILDIYENVLTLLRFTYPKIRRYVNGRQQHKSMLCAVFVMTFIESMLNPSKSLKEKIKHALAEENRDLFIKDNQFKLLNRNIPRVLPLQTPQIIDDCNI